MFSKAFNMEAGVEFVLKVMQCETRSIATLVGTRTIRSTGGQQSGCRQSKALELNELSIQRCRVNQVGWENWRTLRYLIQTRGEEVKCHTDNKCIISTVL